MSQLNTLSAMARENGVEQWQIRHVIDSLSLRPETRAGNCRIYSDRVAKTVSKELRRIASKRAQADAPAGGVAVAG